MRAMQITDTQGRETERERERQRKRKRKRERKRERRWLLMIEFPGLCPPTAVCVCVLGRSHAGGTRLRKR